MLFLVLLPRQALALPDSYALTLVWDASPSAEVAGYRVYYGAASGSYTNSMVVGNVRTCTVPGLVSGATYFFAITAYTAGGPESDFSNEISFVPGVPTVQIRVTSRGPVILTVKGLIGHTYEIQVTRNLKTWTVLGAVTAGADGSVNFIDAKAGSVGQRFYRTRDTQP
jgi:hypothetical protein